MRTVMMVLVLSWAGSAHAAAHSIFGPSVEGDVLGVELLPQFGNHGAVFLFRFDGSSGEGWGWVEVEHESPLPSDTDGDDTPGAHSVDITGGRGVLWVGWRRYQIAIHGGTITAVGGEKELFDLSIGVTLSNWQGSAPHAFMGWLTHEVFPPMIAGGLEPIP